MLDGGRFLLTFLCGPFRPEFRLDISGAMLASIGMSPRTDRLYFIYTAHGNCLLGFGRIWIINRKLENKVIISIMMFLVAS